MNSRIILFIVGLIALVLFLGSTRPVLACDPRSGDSSDCPVTPTFTPNSSAFPTAVTTLIATGNKPSGDNSTSLTMAPSSPELSFPLACLLPDGDNLSNALGVVDLCPAMPIQLRTVKVVTTPGSFVPKAAVVPTVVPPKGDSPSSAKSIVDTWQLLDPGAVHWYRIDNGNNFFLDVWLDTNGVSGIGLALYSPEQTNALSIDLPAKGRGGPVKNEPHDLLWKGSYATGVWYALVRNYNSTPVQYKIGTVQSSANRNCQSYPEMLPSGEHVIWTDCGHYTDPSKK